MYYMADKLLRQNFDIAVGNTSKSQFYSRDSRISYMLKSLLWLVQCFLIMRITERLA